MANGRLQGAPTPAEQEGQTAKHPPRGTAQLKTEKGRQRQKQDGGKKEGREPWDDKDKGNKKTGYLNHVGGRDLERMIQTGKLLTCAFRVNAGDRKQAFAGLEGLPADIQIQGFEDQNRAVFGDIVAVEVLPENKWVPQKLRGAARLLGDSAEAVDQVSSELLSSARLEKDTHLAIKSAGSAEAAKSVLSKRLQERPDLRAAGRVMGIVEPTFRRGAIVGVLKSNDRDKGFTLIAKDPRLPQGVVSANDVPEDLRKRFKGDPQLESQTLVVARIQAWSCGMTRPKMVVTNILGQAGEIEIETQAILEMENVDTEDFGPDVLACLPKTPWSISPEELSKRRDLRSVRTFTIDPSTAKDLDDALSFEELGGGRVRVGVHIADVSYFVAPGSALDAKAAERATSVYMVQAMIPMLPPLLCEQLCSLNPGVDRLTFSVIWEMDAEANVISQWTGRTIIRSCAKLAYSHAQAVIANGEAPGESEGPPVALEAPHTWKQVGEDILLMNTLARKLHAKRFQNGALRLDNVKLTFQLDSDHNPEEFAIYEQQEANELVAEFMLLANMSVAQLVGLSFKDNAMLRRHPTPEERKMGELEDAADRLGFKIDCSSAGAIEESLKALRKQGEDAAVLSILQLMATKPIKQAQYFSTGSFPDTQDWRHFALAVPMYTHFTSPIRRYPDIVVHRLLAHLLAKNPSAADSVWQLDPLQDNGTEESHSKERRRIRQQAAAALLKDSKAGLTQEKQHELAELLVKQEVLLEPTADPSKSQAGGITAQSSDPGDLRATMEATLAEQGGNAYESAVNEVRDLAAKSERAAEAVHHVDPSARSPDGVQQSVDSSSFHTNGKAAVSVSKEGSSAAGSPHDTSPSGAHDLADGKPPDAALNPDERAVSVDEARSVFHGDSSQEAAEPSESSPLPIPKPNGGPEMDADGERTADDAAMGYLAGIADSSSCKTPMQQQQQTAEGNGKVVPVDVVAGGEPPDLAPLDLGSQQTPSKDVCKHKRQRQIKGPKVPVSKTLLGSHALEKLAEHCNTRRTAAKACSEASMKLYLCVLLRKRPQAHVAVVTNVNGNRFWDMYVPSLGLELRMHVADQLPEASGSFSEDDQTLHITQKMDADKREEGGKPCAKEFGAPIQNDTGLQPVTLPLALKAFDRLPVVISARSQGEARPLAAHGLLYLAGDSCAIRQARLDA